MMYRHLDGRRHRQSLVYFGEPQDYIDLAYRHTRNPYICVYRSYIHIVRAPRRWLLKKETLRLTPNSEVQSLFPLWLSRFSGDLQCCATENSSHLFK